MDVIASAPGKVFVIGEYGVVDGGPALVATVAAVATEEPETAARLWTPNVAL